MDLTCFIAKKERALPLLNRLLAKGGRQMSSKELRALIRERIHTGQLPPILGGKTFGGCGSDTACDCCGQIIARHEIEYEVQITQPLAASKRIYVAHPQCHWIWWEESGQNSSPSESPGSQSPAWKELTDRIKRPGHSVN